MATVNEREHWEQVADAVRREALARNMGRNLFAHFVELESENQRLKSLIFELARPPLPESGLESDVAWASVATVSLVHDEVDVYLDPQLDPDQVE